LAGVPVISLAGPNNDNLASTWAMDFGAKPATLDETKTLIQQILQKGHFDESLKKDIDVKAKQVLSQRFCHIETSTNDVLRHMIKDTKESFEGMSPYTIRDKRTLLQKIKLIIRKHLPLHYKVPVASRPMLAKFTKRDVLERLSFMNCLNNISRNYRVKELFPNAFFITRDPS
jgi:hypothetical protein